MICAGKRSVNRSRNRVANDRAMEVDKKVAPFPGPLIKRLGRRENSGKAMQGDIPRERGTLRRDVSRFLEEETHIRLRPLLLAI
jgi:hypothetical protein